MSTGSRHFAKEKERRRLEAAKDAKLRAAGDFIAALLEQISSYFTEPVKLTLIVRNPAHPNGSRDVCIGDDDFELAVEAGRRVLAKGQEVKP
jgi:hypothetical protein